jgi:hypothetical protein
MPLADTKIFASRGVCKAVSPGHAALHSYGKAMSDDTPEMIDIPNAEAPAEDTAPTKGEIWDQQPGEPDESYAAFKLFLEDGINRSVNNAYLSRHQGESYPPRNWFRWSIKYKWRERATAFDAWSAKVNPWDRLSHETSAAFLAFCRYRDMEPPRSIRQLWAQVYPEIKFRNTWFNWSVEYKWQERTAAFDQWRLELERAAVRRLRERESERVAQNRRVFMDAEAYLAEQAFKKADEILTMRVAKDSFVEKRGDGKWIIHKATLLSPSYLFAAAALIKAGSDIGRKGHGIKDEDSDTMTAEQFKRLFYKHTGELPKEFPQGALPAPVDNPAVKPEIHLPGENDPLPGQSDTPAAHTVERFKPPIERP